MNVIFQFTCDNAQLAIDEIEQQVRNIGCTASDSVIADTLAAENEDGFDDAVFFIRTNVKSDRKTNEEIKAAIYNGCFEGYEFL